LGDLRQGALYGGGDLSVFAVDDAGDFERGLAVEIGGGGVGFLRGEVAEIGTCRSTLQAFFSKASITAS
jgi:hypothetical protein